MERPEECSDSNRKEIRLQSAKSGQRLNSLKIKCMNTRSLKGKTIELSAETYDANIVCLTETHIDSSIMNHQIFDYQCKQMFRKVVEEFLLQ